MTIVKGSTRGLLGALLAQPAAWTVPAAFAVMITVSLFTQRTVPVSANRIMVLLHAPESLVLDRGEVRSGTRGDRNGGRPANREASGDPGSPPSTRRGS